jgi:hypothetical protein
VTRPVTNMPPVADRAPIHVHRLPAVHGPHDPPGRTPRCVRPLLAGVALATVHTEVVIQGRWDRGAVAELHDRYFSANVITSTGTLRLAWLITAS